MANLFLHELFSRKIAIIGWSIGLALFGSLYIALYPQIQSQLQTLASISIYKNMGMEMNSFEGFVASSVVQFMNIILLIYAILISTQTLAGEEDSDTLELLMTMPIPRWGLLSMKALALAVTLLIIGTLSALGAAFTFALLQNSIATNTEPIHLVVAIISGWPFLMAYLMMGLFFGAIFPSRRIASTFLSVVVIAGYFAKILTISLPSLDAIKPLSLFTFFDTSADILTKGVNWNNVTVLLIVAAVFFLAALISFERRDITVGLWPWQNTKKKVG